MNKPSNTFLSQSDRTKAPLDVDLEAYEETKFFLEGLHKLHPDDNDFWAHYETTLELYRRMTPEQRAERRKWVAKDIRQSKKTKWSTTGSGKRSRKKAASVLPLPPIKK